MGPGPAHQPVISDLGEMATCRCRDHHQIGLFSSVLHRLRSQLFRCRSGMVSAESPPYQRHLPTQVCHAGGFSKPCGHQCQSAAGRPASRRPGRPSGSTRAEQSSARIGAPRKDHNMVIQIYATVLGSGNSNIKQLLYSATSPILHFSSELPKGDEEAAGQQQLHR